MAEAQDLREYLEKIQNFGMPAANAAYNSVQLHNFAARLAGTNPQLASAITVWTIDRDKPRPPSTLIPPIQISDEIKPEPQSSPSITKEDINQFAKEAEARGHTFNELLDQIYSAQQEAGKRQIEEQYNPLREQQINEQAALGTLRQGTGQNILNAFDVQKQKSLAQLMNEIAQSRTTSKIGVAQSTAQDIQRARELGISTGLKEKELGLEGSKLSLSRLLGLAELGQRQTGLGLEQGRLNQLSSNALIDQILQREGMSQAERLGILQAESRKPGILDYINTAFSGVNALANIGTAAGGFGKIFSFGDSNESFCSLVAMKNLLLQLGKKIKMSKLFKVIEDKGYREIDYGYLLPEQIVDVLSYFGLHTKYIEDAKLNGSKFPVICVVNCADYYGIESEKWLHAIVVTTDRKVIDGYEHCLLIEYGDKGQEYIENAKKYDWTNWRGQYFEIIEGKR